MQISDGDIRMNVLGIESQKQGAHDKIPFKNIFLYFSTEKRKRI